MKKYLNINKIIGLTFTIFVLFSLFLTTQAQTKPTTLNVRQVDVSGTEISLSLMANWEYIPDDKTDRTVTIYIKGYSEENTQDWNRIIPLPISEFTPADSYTKMANIIIDGLTPEKNYSMEVIMDIKPFGFNNNFKAYPYNQPIYVKTAPATQTNLTKVTPINEQQFYNKIAPEDASGNFDNTYNLLAPIGDITTAPDNIGDYFNTIFKLAIGLCIVLAVIMIVIGGFEYMGDESVFGKTEAKKRIFAAILGLLIALGSYALLNTINPDLLGKGGVNINSVSADILEPPLQSESSQIPAPGTAVGTGANSCPEGVEKVQTTNATVHVCKRIATKVKELFDLASSKGVPLSGSAFRSYSDQLQARTANKCPDIYKSPSSACNPPTALPGTSMHEGGLAIDFKCSGDTIRTTDNSCFLFLQQNASKYGLINYSKEPWHWSTNGR